MDIAMKQITMSILLCFILIFMSGCNSANNSQLPLNNTDPVNSSIDESSTGKPVQESSVSQNPDVSIPESQNSLDKELTNALSEGWKTVSFEMFEFDVPADWVGSSDNEFGILNILNTDGRGMSLVTYSKEEMTGQGIDTLESFYKAMTDTGVNKDSSNLPVIIGSYDAMLIYTISTVESEDKILRYIVIDLSDSMIIGMSVYYESEKATYEEAITKVLESFSIAN